VQIVVDPLFVENKKVVTLHAADNFATVLEPKHVVAEAKYTKAQGANPVVFASGVFVVEKPKRRDVKFEFVLPESVVIDDSDTKIHEAIPIFLVTDCLDAYKAGEKEIKELYNNHMAAGHKSVEKYDAFEKRMKSYIAQWHKKKGYSHGRIALDTKYPTGMKLDLVFRSDPLPQAMAASEKAAPGHEKDKPKPAAGAPAQPEAKGKGKEEPAPIGTLAVVFIREQQGAEPQAQLTLAPHSDKKDGGAAEPKSPVVEPHSPTTAHSPWKLLNLRLYGVPF